MGDDDAERQQQQSSEEINLVDEKKGTIERRREGKLRNMVENVTLKYVCECQRQNGFSYEKKYLYEKYIFLKLLCVEWDAEISPDSRWAMRTRFLHRQPLDLLSESEKHVNVVIKNIQMTTVESLI